MSKNRLRKDVLLDKADSIYVRVIVDRMLAGHAFACFYVDEEYGKLVCWITQLVVHRDYRRRGLATGLLSQLKNRDYHVYGLMSSHPAACLATINAFGK